MIKELDLAPVGFDQYVVLQGDFDSLTVLRDHFILWGDPDQSVLTHLWLAATGTTLPSNVEDHLQTFVWQSASGKRLVVHVFKLFGPPEWTGTLNQVWRTESNTRFFGLDVNAHFIHIETNLGGFNLWYITDTQGVPERRYEIVNGATSPHDNVVFVSGQQSIVHVATALRATGGGTLTLNAAPAQSMPAAVRNGMVFEYEKQDGSVRMVYCSRIEFTVIGGRQAINAWDKDRQDWRTFYLDQIVEFPMVQADGN